MDDLLKSLGLTDIGKGKLAYTGPVGSLPVLGPGPTADAVAATTAHAARTASPLTGRVPLGNLGADFMQALITTSGLHAGTDPAVRAAQEQANGQKTQIAQSTKQTAILEAQSTVLSEVHDVLVDIRAFFNRLTMPNAVPINPLQVYGVGRPS